MKQLKKQSRKLFALTCICLLFVTSLQVTEMRKDKVGLNVETKTTEPELKKDVESKVDVQTEDAFTFKGEHAYKRFEIGTKDNQYSTIAEALIDASMTGDDVLLVIRENHIEQERLIIGRNNLNGFHGEVVFDTTEHNVTFAAGLSVFEGGNSLYYIGEHGINVFDSDTNSSAALVAWESSVKVSKVNYENKGAIAAHASALEAYDSVVEVTGSQLLPLSNSIVSTNTGVSFGGESTIKLTGDLQAKSKAIEGFITDKLDTSCLYLNGDIFVSREGNSSFTSMNGIDLMDKSQSVWVDGNVSCLGSTIGSIVGVSIRYDSHVGIAGDFQVSVDAQFFTMFDLLYDAKIEIHGSVLIDVTNGNSFTLGSLEEGGKAYIRGDLKASASNFVKTKGIILQDSALDIDGKYEINVAGESSSFCALQTERANVNLKGDLILNSYLPSEEVVALQVFDASTITMHSLKTNATQAIVINQIENENHVSSKVRVFNSLMTSGVQGAAVQIVAENKEDVEIVVGSFDVEDIAIQNDSASTAHLAVSNPIDKSITIHATDNAKIAFASELIGDIDDSLVLFTGTGELVLSKGSGVKNTKGSSIRFIDEAGDLFIAQDSYVLGRGKQQNDVVEHPNSENVRNLGVIVAWDNINQQAYAHQSKKDLHFYSAMNDGVWETKDKQAGVLVNNRLFIALPVMVAIQPVIVRHPVQMSYELNQHATPLAVEVEEVPFGTVQYQWYKFSSEKNA